MTVSVNLLHKYVWKSHDGIIRLIDYDDKEEANKQIKRLYEVFYNVRIKKDQL